MTMTSRTENASKGRLKRAILLSLTLGAAAVGYLAKAPEAQACGTCTSESGGSGQYCHENWVSAYNCVTYLTMPPTCASTSSCVRS